MREGILKNNGTAESFPALFIIIIHTGESIDLIIHQKIRTRFTPVVSKPFSPPGPPDYPLISSGPSPPVGISGLSDSVFHCSGISPSCGLPNMPSGLGNCPPVPSPSGIPGLSDPPGISPSGLPFAAGLIHNPLQL